jgi:hypothetical protein
MATLTLFGGKEDEMQNKIFKNHNQKLRGTHHDMIETSYLFQEIYKQ